MAFYGAHITYVDKQGELKKKLWQHYGSYARCFAGLSEGMAKPDCQEGTIRAYMSAKYTTHNNARKQEIHRKIFSRFLMSNFCQKLTDGAILGSAEKGERWGPDNELVVDSFYDTVVGIHAKSQMEQVVFNPCVNADKLITAFRIAQSAYKYDYSEQVENIPEELYEYYPLAVALKYSDGETFCDGKVIFGSPKKHHALAAMENEGYDDFGDLYYDDFAGGHEGDGFSWVTVDGIKDLMERTPEQFEAYCRAGVNPSLLVDGYVKDESLWYAKFDGLRDDDPLSITAPCRMTVFTGERVGGMSAIDIAKLLKQFDK